MGSQIIMLEIYWNNKKIIYNKDSQFIIQIGKGKRDYQTIQIIIGDIKKAIEVYNSLEPTIRKRLMFPNSVTPTLAKHLGV